MPTDRELRLAAGAFLALVFAIAAIAKLRDRRGFIETLRALGLSQAGSPAAVTGIPLLEFAVAAMLAVPATTTTGGLAALLVLYIFTLAVIAALLLGRAPDCRCFGSIRPAPIGRTTIIRNAIFAAAAAYVAWPLIGGVLLELALAAVTALAVVLGALVVRLRRLLAAPRSEEGPLPALPSDPRVGEVVPPFDLPAAAGGRVNPAALTAAGKPALLIFMGLNCQACHRMVPTIAAWHQQHAAAFTLAIVMRDSPAANFMFDHTGPAVLLQGKNEVTEAYGVVLTPAAIVIDTQGRFASGVATGPDEIGRLVAAVISGRLPAGTPPSAPA